MSQLEVGLYLHLSNYYTFFYKKSFAKVGDVTDRRGIEEARGIVREGRKNNTTSSTGYASARQVIVQRQKDFGGR